MRELPAQGFLIFRVIRMDGGGIDHKLHIVFDVFRLLRPAVVDGGSLAFQAFGQRRAAPVRAGHGKAFGKQDLRKTAHADAADADEIDMDRTAEIYLINILYLRHGNNLPFSF